MQVHISANGIHPFIGFEVIIKLMLMAVHAARRIVINY